MKQKKQAFSRSLLSVAISSLGMVLTAPTIAAPQSFSETPPIIASKPPAPNVIVAIDDSGSMSRETSNNDTRERIIVLKEAVKATFTPAFVPYGSIRLGWVSMHRCPNIPCDNSNYNNELGLYDATREKNFNDWVAKIAPRGGTPTQKTLHIAYEHLQKKRSWWADPAKPESDADTLACRRSYTVFMTDGGWNSLSSAPNKPAVYRGNLDATPRTLPDGTHYSVTDPQTQIYRDGYDSGADPRCSTVADLAFDYWATDLAPHLPNKLTPKYNVNSDVTVTNGSRSVNLERYWNPRNDPATWQHMNVYSIGFAEAADLKNPRFGSSTWDGGDYPALVTGNKAWPGDMCGGGQPASRPADMWHASLNSRGKFIPVKEAVDLTKAFQDILGEIILDARAPINSLATSSGSTRRESEMFVSGYSYEADPASDAIIWQGQVSAFKLAAGTGQADPAGLWGTYKNDKGETVPQTTASIMDAKPSNFHKNRVVLSSKASNSMSGSTSVGIAFEWGNLSPAQKTILGEGDDTIGKQTVDFLKGDHSQEGLGTFRKRKSRHGDIVNSKIWFTHGNFYGSPTASPSRKDMLYVGANDGMLHGFDAKTGEEKIAYIPRGVFDKARQFSRPEYQHKYMVDGSPFTADVLFEYTDPVAPTKITKAKTYLAGFLGAGSKGYFVLDVTNPDNFSNSNASSLVILDTTVGNDKDIGHVFGSPAIEEPGPIRSLQMTKMNNGRWALVTGNGYNSIDEKAVLLIQYLDGDKSLLKITADNTPGNGNGLSTPRLVDLNGDNLPDIVYAGDLKGNLWKFDISSSSPSDWKVAFNGNPLFKTTNARAITSAPAVVSQLNRDGVMVMIGTGQLLTEEDKGARDQETLYSIYDTTSWDVTATGQLTIDQTNNSIANSSGLVQQTTTMVSAEQGWNVSDNKVDFKTTTVKGWYIDLPLTGARIIQNIRLLTGSYFQAQFTIPMQGTDPDAINQESCDVESGESAHYLADFNAFSGIAPKYLNDNNGTLKSFRKDTMEGVSLALGGDTGTEGDAITTLGGDPNAAPDQLLFGVRNLSPAWRQIQ